jgi:AraC-like DNA-binding protein
VSVHEICGISSLMDKEPTTISSVAQLIAEVLQTHYNVDPIPLLEEAGLDPALLNVPGTRYPRENIMNLWKIAARTTVDPCIGLTVGLKVRTTSFHALSCSWLASQTLLEALQRLARYHRIIATVPLEIEINEKEDSYELEVRYPNPKFPGPPIALDSFMGSIIGLCRTATNSHFHPLKVSLGHGDNDRASEYIKGFECPVDFMADKNAFYFDKESLLAHLPGNNPDIAKATDKVAEHYLEMLDPNQVTTKVRKLLINLLPTGEANQQIIASRLAKSVSTLQRQLRDEGTSFRTIQDETRQRLAEDYVQDGEYSLSEIAYLLGFTDQSNFSRAFRRWNGTSPSGFLEDSQDKH